MVTGSFSKKVTKKSECFGIFNLTEKDPTYNVKYAVDTYYYYHKNDFLRKKKLRKIESSRNKNKKKNHDRNHYNLCLSKWN